MLVACDHNGAEPLGCWSFACRAAVWCGPGGITADDLRYSVVYTIESRFRIGERWPRPEPLDGVAWEFCRRESCDDDGFVAYVYSAAMNRRGFESLVGSAESDGESGGIVSPSGLPSGAWVPSVILLRETWRYERFTVTAWRADRALDEHLFDEWPDVCALLSGKRSAFGGPS